MDDVDEMFKFLIDQGKAHTRRKQQIKIAQLITAGLVKPPMAIEADYTPEDGPQAGRTVHLEGTIQSDSSVKIQGHVYSSLSMAASMAQQRFHAKPQGHQKHEVNGWEFWFFRDGRTGKLKKMDELRNEYVTRVLLKL